MALMIDEIYFDREGNPITFDEYAALLAAKDWDYRRVALSVVGDQWISTVWLGCNHRLSDGTPIIFESMVWPECDEMRRYCTETEALEGHVEMYRELKGNQ